jgi:hypothetical protein
VAYKNPAYLFFVEAAPDATTQGLRAVKMPGKSAIEFYL